MSRLSSLAAISAAFFPWTSGLGGPPRPFHKKKVRLFRDGWHDNRNLFYDADGRRWKLQDNGNWRSRGEEVTP